MPLLYMHTKKYLLKYLAYKLTLHFIPHSSRAYTILMLNNFEIFSVFLFVFFIIMLKKIKNFYCVKNLHK